MIKINFIALLVFSIGAGFIFFDKTIDIPNQIISNNETVEVTYNQPVNGYDVQISWQPQSVYSDYLVGPAIFLFYDTNSENSFSVVTNYFALPSEKVHSRIEDYKVKEIFTSNINLNYTKPKLSGSGQLMDLDNPFLFLDVNFDGKQELLITEYFNGQRYVNTFKVYELQNRKIVDDFFQITDKEPFDELDQLSHIQPQEKKVIIKQSGGVCGSIYKYYSLDSNGNLILSEIFEYSNEGKIGSHCIKKHYLIHNGEKRLVDENVVN